MCARPHAAAAETAAEPWRSCGQQPAASHLGVFEECRWRQSEVQRACANMCLSRFLFWGPKMKAKTKGTVPLPHCSRCIIACMCRARSFVARRLGPERVRVLNIAATTLGEDRPLAGSPMCWRSGPLLVGYMEQQRINIQDKACTSSALGFASVWLRLRFV